MTWSIVSGGRSWKAAVLGLALLAGSAQAALFGDDEARKAILDLRQKVDQSAEQQRQQQAEQNAQLLDQIGQLRRSLLDTNNQLEQLARDLSEAQLKMRDVDGRLRRLEPQKASIDGKEFTAEADEIRQYEAAMTQVRNGEFAVAVTSLSAFVSRWPARGYGPSALFWLGNAQYGKRDYAAAIASFRSFASSNGGRHRTQGQTRNFRNRWTFFKSGGIASRH